MGWVHLHHMSNFHLVSFTHGIVTASSSRLLIILLLCQRHKIVVVTSRENLAYAKKAHISCADQRLFFATYIEQSIYILNLKFQASSQLLCFYSPVCVGNPKDRVFS